MNYEEEKHAEKLLADGWLSNDQAHQLKTDCLTLACQLYGEDESRLSVGAKEVMQRWGKKCFDALKQPSPQPSPHKED